MTEEQQEILERILKYYPDDKKQEVKDCVVEFAENIQNAHVGSMTKTLLYLEQVLLMGQVDKMPKNIDFKKLKDECDKAMAKKQLPAIRNTKPFYTKFLNKRHKRNKRK